MVKGHLAGLYGSHISFFLNRAVNLNNSCLRSLSLCHFLLFPCIMCELQAPQVYTLPNLFITVAQYTSTHACPVAIVTIPIRTMLSITHMLNHVAIVALPM